MNAEMWMMCSYECEQDCRMQEISKELWTTEFFNFHETGMNAYQWKDRQG